MKKMIILFGSLVLSGTGLYANKVGDARLTAPGKIKNAINIPESLKKQGMEEKVKVKVVFTVNEAGNVEQVVAVSKNPELKKEVEKQFLHLSFEGFKAGAANTVMLNFKVY